MGGIYHICYSDDGSFAPAHTDIVPQRIEVKMAMDDGHRWMKLCFKTCSFWAKLDGSRAQSLAIFMGQNMAK